MIDAYLIHPITVVRQGAPDKYGSRPAPTLEPAMAYHEQRRRIVRDVDGEEVISSGSVLMEYDPLLKLNDFIRIGGTDYVILSIDRLGDFDTRGMTVYLQ